MDQGTNYITSTSSTSGSENEAHLILPVLLQNEIESMDTFINILNNYHTRYFQSSDIINELMSESSNKSISCCRQMVRSDYHSQQMPKCREPGKLNQMMRGSPEEMYSDI